MNRINILLVAVIVMLASCSPEKMPNPTPVDGDAISASVTSLSFSAEGGTENVTITSNFSWETVSKPSWITVSPSTGSKGSTNLTITAETSTSTSSRTGTITLGNSSKSVSISVSQGASPGGGASITIPVTNSISIKMIKVDGGTFTMGATSEQGSDAFSDEVHTHSVTLSDYYIGETEVTQELWEAVMGSNPSLFKGSKRPVEEVSWNDCQAFIKKLKEKTGKSFRLPTEAEWEYAARGGKNSKGYKYSGSNTLGDVAWYSVNGNGETHTVATKQANELGLYDMSGNVFECCQDWYGSYSSNSQTNPTGASSGPGRVYRGGEWVSLAWGCRVSYRFHYTPDRRDSGLGLRLAL